MADMTLEPTIQAALATSIRTTLRMIVFRGKEKKKIDYPPTRVEIVITTQTRWKKRKESADEAWSMKDLDGGLMIAARLILDEQEDVTETRGWDAPDPERSAASRAVRAKLIDFLDGLEELVHVEATMDGEGGAYFRLDHGADWRGRSVSPVVLHLHNDEEN